MELDNPFTKTNRTAIVIDQINLQHGIAAFDATCDPDRLTILIADLLGEQGERWPEKETLKGNGTGHWKLKI